MPSDSKAQFWSLWLFCSVQGIYIKCRDLFYWDMKNIPKWSFMIRGFNLMKKRSSQSKAWFLSTCFFLGWKYFLESFAAKQQFDCVLVLLFTVKHMYTSTFGFPHTNIYSSVMWELAVSDGSRKLKMEKHSLRLFADRDLHITAGIKLVSTLFIPSLTVLNNPRCPDEWWQVLDKSQHWPHFGLKSLSRVSFSTPQYQASAHKPKSDV